MSFLTAFLLLCMHSSIVSNAGGSNVQAGNCTEKERQALLKFKADITDKDGFLSTWSMEEEEDCCKWHGVECSYNTGHVVKLDLRNRYSTGLRGKISPSLLELHRLNYLDLSFNLFVTPIPKFVSSLTKLKYLDLSGHGNFDGTIPTYLGNLSNLQTLRLSGTGKNVENIEWLSHLSHLQKLVMDDVDLSKANYWVDVISRLPSLSYLNLSYCDLSEVKFPFRSSINSSSTSTLEILDLSRNNFTSSMYSWLFNLTSNNLVHLNLADNQLVGSIPESFGNLSSLQILDLQFNHLQGVIPKSLGSLCNLRYLLLSENYLNGDLSYFLHKLLGCAEKSLEGLFFQDNRITGSIPDSVGRFLSLIAVFLSGNNLNGTISEKLGQLTNLEYLDISFNSLKGVVTENHFSNLTSLVHLEFSSNALLLTSSSQWLPPFQLQHIGLRSCMLGPHFPTWIRTQKSLGFLNIANTSISDSIPMWFWKFSATLELLDLSLNHIRGRVPDLLSRFNLLAMIDLSSNHFQGPIPSLPSNLTTLNLSKNNFSGAVLSLCQIGEPKLTFVDLSRNLLTGELPDCLSHFTDLVVLNVAHNKLSGRIPKSIGSLYHLQTLYLYNNRFSGRLPSTLRNCSMLSFLNLGRNRFSGGIPAWVGENIKRLYALGLGWNKFSGAIPLQLCQLKVLNILDLSVNHLSGTIPRCFHNFTSMVEKGLSNTETNHEYMSLTHEGFSIDTIILDFADYSIIRWQGREIEFTSNLKHMKSIDLASNNFTGEIPVEITGLFGLVALNLSSNQLHGEIPQNIGQLESIMSLDLSRNRLSGQIPTSMSGLHFLGFLDLSYNDMSGRIPSGTQLQSFDPSSYAGNERLCGPPLTQNCPEDQPPHVPLTVGSNEGSLDGRDELWRGFEIGMGTGFAAGFWGICCVLLLNRRYSRAFFLFLYNLQVWFDVKLARQKAKFQSIRAPDNVHRR